MRVDGAHAGGRESRGLRYLWVSGGNWDFESGENPIVQIIPDKKTYAAGERRS